MSAKIIDQIQADMPDVKITTHKYRTLHKNELLGCTCPHIDAEAVYSLVDGLFHLEAVEIANPNVQAFQVNLILKEINEAPSEVREHV